MTTIDELPFHDGHESPATANGAKGARPRKSDDPVKARRGRSSDRLGKDQERRIERVYGPRKVGEYGDAVDHLGRDFKWQAKATRKHPPLWLAAIDAPTWRPIVPKSVLDPMAHMTGIGGSRRPLVIRSYVHQGVPTRDWIFVVGIDWFRLYGTASIPGFGGFVIPGGDFGYVVMPGSAFLELHGRDLDLHGPGAA
jgi:hypothetical protein